ncbi:hypothetical protein [Agrobacterium rubi]|uniref:MarR family transcriptional regulator n=1 Tax=Agrobacterium rubi TaxID=28099 RepID=A0ABX2J2J7_9HYPH|nr:hypothetical protein [Agrobacterium rubi]NTF35532.1 hypothetical protein [Agrobacterium rubi]
MTNTLFASYVTGSAFRIDLSSRMVSALTSAAAGNRLDTSNYGVDSLLRRGLVEVADGQERHIYKAVRLTDAGMKVAELCAMAGLGAQQAKEVA